MRAETTDDDARTRIYLEVGGTRAFACAIDWPGWARSVRLTKTRREEAAIDELAAYVGRYAAAVAAAGFDVPARHTFEVVERVPGDASTDFGIPGSECAADAEPLTAVEAAQQVAMMRAAWSYLDQVYAETSPALQKGPRGGGRDRDPMYAHVVEAEASYARMVGIRRPPPASDDATAIAALRDELAAVLVVPSTGEPLRPKGWRPRYAIRRIIWHVLDHAWEMQDKTL